MLEEDLFAEAVQAVDLMEDVDFSDEGIGPEAEVGRVLGGCKGVLAKFDNVVAAHGYCADVGDAVPGGIHGWRWIFAVNGWGVGVQ